MDDFIKVKVLNDGYYYINKKRIIAIRDNNYPRIDYHVKSLIILSNGDTIWSTMKKEEVVGLINKEQNDE